MPAQKHPNGGKTMGNSSESTALALKNASIRWRRARSALDARDQPYADILIAMIERHLDGRIPHFDDPLEAVIFVVLVEMEKRWQRDHPAGASGSQQVLLPAEKIPGWHTLQKER